MAPKIKNEIFSAIKKAIFSSIETISPQLAAAYLGSMIKRNRLLRPKRVREYASLMTRDLWELNGESIKFNSQGQLIDGQHRLSASVASGKTFQSLVVRGIDTDAALATIDNGAPRSDADYLGFNGISYGCLVSAAARRFLWIQRAEAGLPVSKTAGQLLSNRHDMLMAVTETPLLLQGASAITKIPKPRNFCSHALLLALWCRMVEESDISNATTFMQQLCTGENLVAGNPILAVRNRLLETAMATLTKSGGPLNTDMRKALAIAKAWNFWIAEADMGRLILGDKGRLQVLSAANARRNQMVLKQLNKQKGNTP